MHKIIPSDDFSTRSQYTCTFYYISFVHLLYMARDIQTKYCIHICKPGNTTINYSCMKIYTCTARYDFVSCLHFEYPVIKMHSNWGGGGIYNANSILWIEKDAKSAEVLLTFFYTFDIKYIPYMLMINTGN